MTSSIGNNAFANPNYTLDINKPKLTDNLVNNIDKNKALDPAITTIINSLSATLKSSNITNFDTTIR